MDAHPANLSLLVSYEIEVILLDNRNKRELARRSKQSQIQIHLKSLERLLTQETTNDLCDIGAIVDRDAREIIEKFPIIKFDKLQEIKHHMTYLYKRHSDEFNSHSRLSEQESSVGNDYKQQTFQKLIKSARVNSASISSTGKNRSNNPQETPKTYNVNLTDEQLLEYMFKLDDQEELEKADISQLNKYIEGLYDDLEEKIASSRKIRSLANCVENLMELAVVNKMLTSAMYRVLREDGNKSIELAKNVLSYFIQLSGFIEFTETLRHYDLINTVTSLAKNLANDSVGINSDESGAGLGQTHISEQIQILEARRACILLLFNLSQVTISYEVQLYKCEVVELLLSCIIDIAITRDTAIKHQTYHRCILKLSTTALIFLQRLSAYKKNIDIIKQSSVFLEKLINVLNISYLEIRDKYKSLADSSTCRTTLTSGHSEFLLISAFQLINNLLYDDHIRKRISENDLFKIAFSVFVVHQNRKSTTKLNIGSICRCHQCFSSLSIMYQMSCDIDFNRKIAKSRLVNKCLLDYAKSVALNIDEQSSAYNWEGNRFETNNFSSEQVYNSISTTRYDQDNNNSSNLKLTSLDHLMLAFFINVTTTKNFIISVNRSDTSSQLTEYIRIVMIKLSADSQLSENFEQSSYKRNDCSSSFMNQNRLDIVIYLHLKIIRNITQYYKHLSEQIRFEFQNSWFHILLSFAMRHFNLCRPFSDDLILESIGILGNYTQDKGDNKTKINWLKILENTDSSDLLMHNLDISRNLTDDDTVLVSIYFVGTLLEDIDCYRLLASKGLVSKIKQIMDLRQDDEEILIHSLYALICTIIHGGNCEQLDSKSSTSKCS